MPDRPGDVYWQLNPTVPPTEDSADRYTQNWQAWPPSLWPAPKTDPKANAAVIVLGLGARFSVLLRAFPQARSPQVEPLTEHLLYGVELVFSPEVLASVVQQIQEQLAPFPRWERTLQQRLRAWPAQPNDADLQSQWTLQLLASLDWQQTQQSLGGQDAARIVTRKIAQRVARLTKPQIPAGGAAPLGTVDPSDRPWLQQGRLLQALLDASNPTLGPQGILRRAADAILTAFGVSRCQLVFFDAKTHRLSWTGVARTADLLARDRLARYPTWADLERVMASQGHAATGIIDVPMVRSEHLPEPSPQPAALSCWLIADGEWAAEWAGAIVTLEQWDQPRDWQSGDMYLLHMAIQQVAQALYQALLYQRAEERLQRATLLEQLTQQIRNSLDASEIFHTALRSLTQLLIIDCGLIVQPPPTTDADFTLPHSPLAPTVPAAGAPSPKSPSSSTPAPSGWTTPALTGVTAAWQVSAAYCLTTSSDRSPFPPADPQAPGLATSPAAPAPTPPTPNLHPWRGQVLFAAQHPYAQRLQRQEMVVISPPDCESHEGDPHLPPTSPLRQYCGSWLLIPIQYEQHTWGAIAFFQAQPPRHWHDSELSFLGSVADQLAIAIHQSNLYRAIQTQNQILAAQIQAQVPAPDPNTPPDPASSPVAAPGAPLNTDPTRHEDLALALQAAWEMNRAQTEFLDTVSHELRTALTAILGMSSSLLKQYFGQLNAKQQEYVQIIYRSGEQLLTFADELPERTAAFTHTPLPPANPCDVRNLAAVAIQQATPLANDQQTRLEWTYLVPELVPKSGPESGPDLGPDAEEPFWGNADRLAILFKQVLDYALRSLPVPDQVQLTLRQHPQMLLVQVEAWLNLAAGHGPNDPEPPLLACPWPPSDLTEAIAPPSQDWTVRPAANTPMDLPLGLLLAGQNVLLQGGEIRCDHQADHRLTILIQLPNCPPSTGDRSAPPDPESPSQD
jgi:GAF domain-containing protein